MEFRLAIMNDLEELKEMYGKIIVETEKTGHPIWGGDYPVEFLHVDVEKKRMFVLVEDGRIISSLALCPSIWDDRIVPWEDNESKAMYVERLAVRPDHWEKGIGGRIMKEAEKKAKMLGSSYMRLYVIESNKPAFNLYRKLGYHQIGGEFAIPVEDHYTLHTNVMEKKLI